jgi:hypothetical protein
VLRFRNLGKEMKRNEKEWKGSGVPARPPESGMCVTYRNATWKIKSDGVQRNEGGMAVSSLDSDFAFEIAGLQGGNGRG